MIKVKDAMVELTEAELRKIVAEFEKAKRVIPFTNDPMLDGDMTEEVFRYESSLRGNVFIKCGLKLEFKIKADFSGAEVESRTVFLDFSKDKRKFDNGTQ